jgi:succinyl-CoA synthetase beta subunit
MKLYEYEAKQIFKKYGLEIPKQIAVIEKPEAIDNHQLSFPLMVKAMVLIGGRGKAGGIKKADNLDEAKEFINEMFQISIRGFPIEKILLEETVSISNEIYLAVTTDPATFDIVIVASASGGVDIEEVAKTNPELIWKHTIYDNPLELEDSIAEEAANFLTKNFPNAAEIKINLKEAITSLYSTFQNIEAKICEINPLIVTTHNQIIAADAKVVLDDNSLYRQEPLLKSIGIDPRSKRHDVSEQTVFEAKAYRIGFPYLDLLESPENFVEDS